MGAMRRAVFYAYKYNIVRKDTEVTEEAQRNTEVSKMIGFFSVNLYLPLCALCVTSFWFWLVQVTGLNDYPGQAVLAGPGK